jgi:hypothetical protein
MLALQATNKVLFKKNEWNRKHESIGDQIRNINLTTSVFEMRSMGLILFIIDILVM